MAKEAPMSKPMIIGCGLLLVAVLIGCGGSSDDPIAKEHIALLNEMAGIYENVTDLASFTDALAKVQRLDRKARDLEAKTKDWSEEKKNKYQSEIETAKERLQKALKAAARKLGKDFKIPKN